MDTSVTIERVEFRNFKAFSNFSLSLQRMNILVGPNNSGKSTIIGAFRVLAIALRRARAKSAELVQGPDGSTWGHVLRSDDLPISVENAQTDFNDTVPTSITFHLSNTTTLTLFFPQRGRVIFIPGSAGAPVKSPSGFSRLFPIAVDAIPVLGPLEHDEVLVEKQTVQRNLVTHRASRNFRNYWHYFPEQFESFAGLVRSTWPNMDISPPEQLDPGILSMFCAEDRMVRELYWAGYGFQVWCQMLTHVVRSGDTQLLVVDEPEIYLHPDLQRQLLTLLRDLGPTIVMATHSTEILSEAEPSEIAIIDKSRRSAQRLRESSQIQYAIDLLGSNRNIALTQAARTQRVFIVEGADFDILSRYAKLLGLVELASKRDFAVIPVGGFSGWTNIKPIVDGIEWVLGHKPLISALFDRDYRCAEEITAIEAELKPRVTVAHFHERKELENYLLVPSVLERAIRIKLREKSQRSGVSEEPEPIEALLDRITSSIKEEVLSQYISYRLKYFRALRVQESVVTQDALRIFNEIWTDVGTRMNIVPGKDVFSMLNKELSNNDHISLTIPFVISQFRPNEVPMDLKMLLKQLERFRKTPIDP
jgi:energy-coupling factor transporter ATP-binding protein EcfA2